MDLLNSLFHWRHSSCVVQKGRYLNWINITSYEVNRVLRASVLLITVICYVKGVSLGLWQHSVRLRAVEHLFKVNRCVERLRWILAIDLCLAALYRLSYHLLVRAIRVLLLRLWLFSGVSAYFDETWLAF